LALDAFALTGIYEFLTAPQLRHLWLNIACDKEKEAKTWHSLNRFVIF